MNCCIYCGELATTVDHLLPVGWFEGSHRNLNARKRALHNVPTVDACTECNCVLGGKFIPNLIERVRFMGEELVRRNASSERIAFNARMLHELQKEEV